MKKLILVAPFAISLLVLANKGHKVLNLDVVSNENVNYEDIYDLARPCNCPNCTTVRNIGNSLEKSSVVDKIDDQYLKQIKNEI